MHYRPESVIAVGNKEHGHLAVDFGIDVTSAIDGSLDVANTNDDDGGGSSSDCLRQSYQRHGPMRTTAYAPGNASGGSSTSSSSISSTDLGNLSGDVLQAELPKPQHRLGPAGANDSQSMVNTSMLLFGVMGMGTLLPYNALVSSVDWFQSIHPEESSDIAGRLATSCLSSLLVTTVILIPLSTATATSDEQQQEPQLKSTGSGAGWMSWGSYGATLFRSLVANPVHRIAVGFVVESILLFTFALIEPSMPTALTLAFFVGCGDAISQSGLYVYAASVDVRCTAAVALGSAVAGLGSSLLRLVTKAMFRDNDGSFDGGMRQSSSVFFGMTSVLLLCCLTALWATLDSRGRMRAAFGRSDGRCADELVGVKEAVGNSNFELQYVDSIEGGGTETKSHCVNDAKGNDGSCGGRLLDSRGENLSFSSKVKGDGRRGSPNQNPRLSLEPLELGETSPVFHSSSKKKCTEQRWLNKLKWSRLDSSETVRCSSCDGGPGPTATSSFFAHCSLFTWCTIPEKCGQILVMYGETLRVSWKPTVASFLNFFVTLSLFPGTVTSMQSPSGSDGGYWLPVVLVGVFNMFDCVGRAALATKKVSDRLVAHPSLDIRDIEDTKGAQMGQELPGINWWVGYPALLRLLFYPLLWLCVAQPPVIASNGARSLIVAAFAASNGYVNAACFMVAPSMIREDWPRHKDSASLMVLLSSYLGLMMGGYFGMFLDVAVFKIG